MTIKRHFVFKKLLIALAMTICTTATISLLAQNNIAKLKYPQIPILIERNDNILCYIRIDAKEGEILNSVTIDFDESVNLNEIKTLKLYYGGTESFQRKNEVHYAPIQYMSSHAQGNTLEANSSYSLKIDETSQIVQQYTFKLDKPLFPSVNYFWVSIEMKPSTSLLSTVKAKVSSLIIDNQSALDKLAHEQAITRKMGIGVRHAGDDGVAAFRIPGAVTSNKGTLLAVYDIRYNNSVDLQEYVDVGLSRSFDKGKTWQPMQTVMSFGELGGLPKSQNGVGDPAILVDKVTGNIWTVALWTHGMGNGRAWFNSVEGMEMEKTGQVVLSKSEDDGKTWSVPINITKQVKDPSWNLLLQGPGSGITMQDGTLVFACQYKDSLHIPHAGVMYSKDRGATWNIHNGARSKTTEAQVVEISPGVLMLNMRDDRGGSRAVAVTADLGKTWTEHASSRSALQEPVCMASLIKVGAKDNVFEQDILLFSNPNTVKSRNNITIKASLDGGNTWMEENQILLDDDHGWGYSCLTMIDKETVGILYESSVAHMTFQAIKLRDIIRKK